MKIQPKKRKMSNCSVTFDIEGMKCKGCSGRVMRTVSTMDGVKNPVVDLEAKTLKADIEKKSTNDEVVAAINKLGFKAKIRD